MRRISLIGCSLLLGVTTVFAQKNEQYKNADPKELIKRTDLTPKDLEAIQHYYLFDLKDKKRAIELEQLLISKYPKGSFARFVAFQQFNKAKSNAEVITISNNFFKAFPYDEWRAKPNNQGFIYYSIHRMLGTAYFETKQFKNLINFCKPLDYKTENEIYRWNIMRAYTFRTLGQDTLYQVSTALVKELITKVNDGSYVEDGVFNKEQAAANAAEQLDNQLGTHISLLYDMKKYGEAKEYFNYLSAKGTYGAADLNDKHLNILAQTGDQQAVQPFLEKCVSANAMTPKMLDKLKEVYLSQNKEASSYETYFSSLHSGKEQEELKAYVKEHLTNQEYVPFAIEDADGKLVRSSDWGDKIVVLDFWATWCKPCISAFPGMQMLVDKYASDPQVEVYMVGTMQTGDYKQKSTGYVKQQGYRFHLLHDGINKETGEQNAVFKTFVPFFQSSAIPRKVILKDGIMRYTAEGYSGSPSKLADELTYAIELLKSEK
ncbi:TlpA disulfide reductase family protein [Chitinophaga sp. CF418]|uniref:TlpA disulfide reductase family protein n=1 Tax=Chitinophaga sp. CF418 TaxID=1855287 RepID=UPI00092449F6|nr:TlpA disulfide reductase family protein [Chitinophaga sp. CF418]SHN33517.1 AhpC/TSA family protein [Chitinophaga sp. CF418]